MKLKEYLEELNKIIEQNPEALEMEVIYAKDDEGNGYQKVNFSPSLGWADIRHYYIDYFEENGRTEEEPNCVCIN